MKTNIFLAFFSAILAILFTMHAFAKKSDINLDHLRTQVSNFIFNKAQQQLPEHTHNNIDVRTKNIDRRLRLSGCNEALDLHLQGQTIKRNNSVKVSCSGPKPWSIYVGTTIALTMPVVTLKTSLPRHHIITQNDLSSTVLDIYALRSGYASEGNEVIGQQLKRPLRAGDIVYNYHLKAPNIIKKGDQVTIVSNRGGLSVISQGIALSDGQKGENVRIENQRSSRVIQAKVLGPKTVEVL